MEIIIVFLIIAFVMVCYLCHRFKSDRRDSVSQTNRVSGGINTVRVQTKPQEPVASKGGDAKGKQVPQIKVEKQREQQVGVCSAKLSSGETNGENKSFVSFKKEEPYSVKLIPLLKADLNILNIDYSQQYVVNYDLVSSGNLEYPYLVAPEKGTWIKLPIQGRNGRRGFCKEKLANVINKYHLKGFRDNLSLFADGCPYEPDFAYIDVEKGIFIDIEVDEPYSGWEKTPIHYMIGNRTNDGKRNERFTERGWIVLRFSEKQVFEQTMSCLKYLYQQICRIDTSMAIPSSLASVPDLKVDSMWTKADAFQMIQNKTREKMLGISEFIMPSGKFVTSNLIDYEEAGKIEDAIKTLRDDKVWRKYSEKGWWQKYIDERPNGKYVFEAKKKLDDILWVECEQAKNYDLYLKNSELQKHSKEARKLKEEEAKIKAENVRREMERIVALKEEAMRKEEEERLERQKREEEERKKREAENYARQHVSSQTQTRTPSSRGYA